MLSNDFHSRYAKTLNDRKIKAERICGSKDYKLATNYRAPRIVMCILVDSNSCVLCAREMLIICPSINTQTENINWPGISHMNLSLGWHYFVRGSSDVKF